MDPADGGLDVTFSSTSARRSVVAASVMSLLTVAVVIATLLAPAAAAQADGDPEAGAEVFRSSCAMCHGSDATGMMGMHPALTGAVERLGREGVEVTVRNGRATNPPMPAFGNRLSDDQIDDVVSYIDRLPNGSRNFGPGHDVGMGDGMMDGMIGGGSGWMIVVVIILAAALAGIIGYLIGTSRSRRDAAGPRLPLMDDLHPAGGRSRRRRLTLVLILLSVQALVHGSAGAHGGPAVFDVRTDVSGMKVILDVGITYETDGEAAHGAIVHATGTGPGGERIESFPLERAAHGRYVGSTTAPEEGSWRFTIESSFPPGSTTVQVAVGSGAGPSTAAAWWAVLLLAAAAAAGTGTWLLRRRHRRR